MRFTSVVVAGIFAVAVSAQSSQAATATTSSVASATTTDPAQASMLNCINACGENDVDCKADCITVPSPSDEQANDTIDCVAQCPQGNGTEADNAAYGSCVSDCIGQYFYTSTGAPAGATRTATGTASGSGATGTASGGSGTATGTATGTGSSSSSTNEPNSAAAIRTGASAVGLVGFLVAFLTL